MINVKLDAETVFVADLRFELGVESSVTEAELVLVVLCILKT